MEIIYFSDYSGKPLIQSIEIDDVKWPPDYTSTAKAVFQPLLSVSKFTWSCINKHRRFIAVLLANMNYLE